MSALPLSTAKVSGSSALKTQLESTLTVNDAGLEFTIQGGAIYKWNGTSFDQISIGGAAHGYETGVIAGERNIDSATNSYLIARPESNLSIIGKTTAVTIGGGVANDTHLIGVHISTALTGTCVITGFADSDGTATSFTLPIGSIGFKDFRGAINSAGALTVTCGTAGDDNFVAVLWRPV